MHLFRLNISEDVASRNWKPSNIAVEHIYVATSRRMSLSELFALTMELKPDNERGWPGICLRLRMTYHNEGGSTFGEGYDVHTLHLYQRLLCSDYYDYF
jgi:hypothetical protein